MTGQPRRARRTDSNHSEIAEAFEKAGFSVHRTNGDWDLTVGLGGINLLIEIKDGKKSPSRQKLTEREQKFHDTWTGGVYLITSVEDIPGLRKTLLADLEAVKRARMLL